MSRHTTRLIPGFIAFVWLAAIAGLYYIYHKPFSPTLALSLARASGQLIVAFAIAALAGGLGRQLLPAREMQPLARLALQSALGFGLFGLAGLIVGSAIGFNPILAWAALLLGGLILRRDIAEWSRNGSSLLTLWREGGRLGRAIALGLLLLLILGLPSVLAPPLKFDALVYHLALPQAYLNNGRFSYQPGNIFWGMPQTGEMLYTWAMALGGEQAAACLGWLWGILAVVGLLGFVSAKFGARPAWVSAASLLSGTTLAQAMSWGYVDWLVLLFGLGFLVLLDEWRRTGRLRDLWLAGAYAGLALGTKYTAGVLLFCGAAGILWTARRTPKDVLKLLVQFSLPALLVSLPWWVKNFLATGNPAYPFGVPAGAMDTLRLEIYQGMPAWGNWQDALLLPVRATITGLEGAPGYAASIGPLLLALGASAWLSWKSIPCKERETIRSSLLVGGVGILVWIIAGRISGLLIQSRLYFSIFPALAILAGAGFYGLAHQAWPRVRLGRVVGALVLLVFGLNVFEAGLDGARMGALPVLLGLRSTVDYLSGGLGWYYPAARAVHELPPGSHTLLLWEPRSYYCAPGCTPDEVIDRWRRDLAVFRDPASVLDAWQASGFTHLLFFKAGADFIRQDDPRYSPEDWRALDSLLDELSQPQSFGGAYYLYTLRTP